MELFDSIEKLITEHGSAAILRERLGLAQQQYEALDRKVAELTKDLEGANRENENLRRQLAAAKMSDEYVSARGVLWKRAPSGFEPEPYCPKCKLVMSEFPPSAKVYWHCSSCGFRASYTQRPS